MRLLDKEKTDHEGARALLASKTEELRSMRPFLMTADDVPLAEVLTLVEDLNSEVYTTAAAIADYVASEGLWAKGNSSSMGKEGSRSRVAESLGQNMVQLLASNESSTAQENIVLACQAGLLTLCQTLVECWTSPGNPADALLASIYDNMHSIGETRLCSANSSNSLQQQLNMWLAGGDRLPQSISESMTSESRRQTSL